MMLRSIRLHLRVSRGYSTSDEALKTLCKSSTDKAFKAVMTSLKDPVGWELVDKLEDTEVYHNTKNPINTRIWNEPVIESVELKNLGEVKIMYQKVSMPWPLSVRDMVFAEALYPLEAGTAYVMASIEYADAPPIPSAVRSIMNWGAIVAEENEFDNEKCFVTYVSSWSLKEETKSLREANYLIQRRNACILKMRKHLLD